MYIHPSKENWLGRIDSEKDSLSFRYHQIIGLTEPSNMNIDQNRPKSFGIIGFECDEGVSRNQGRVGAAEAPAKIRKALAKLPWHLTDVAELYDVGNIKCEEGKLEDAQRELGKSVSVLLEKGVKPIIIGGGHETLYGHYLGVRESIGADAKLGIINIDAHFDMRPYDDQPSSGTMFKQILDEDPNCSYFVAGIQSVGNTAALFEEAKQYRVQYILEEDLTFSDFERTKGQLCAFTARQDYIILTLCMDVISSGYAPGVSSPSPFGLEPKLIRELIRYITSNTKHLSFDISEVNPEYDEGDKTSTLAAYFINEALMSSVKQKFCSK